MPHLDYTVSHATAGDATGLSSTASSTGWRTPPCRKASCMLTLPAPSSIASIRIVNAGSALIEVLAGKASWTPAQYQVLVPVSCLIPVSQLAPAVDDAAAAAAAAATTTTESSSHGHDDADEAARTFTFRCRDVGDQWERVQVVCRHYDARRRVGLARLILSDSPLLDTKRDDAGARAKAPATSTATSPRAATATAISSSSSAATTSPTTPRARVVSTEPRATTSSSPSPPSSPEAAAAAAAAAASSSRLSPAMLPKTPTVLTAASTTTTSTTASSSSTTALSPKAPKPERRQSDAANVANIDVVPFREILRGVTIVISGIQHPERGQVRDKATAMGARYLPDWNKHATHLICEFSNTPKYQQAKDSGGVIVTRQWINECFKAKARLPEASFLCKSGDEDDDDGADDGEPAAAAAAGTRRARPQRKAKQEAQQKMEPWIVRIDSEDASLLVGDLSDEAEDVDGGDDDDDDEEGDGSARGGAKKRRAAKRKPTSPRTRRAAKRPKPNDDDEYNDDSQAQGGDDDDDDDEEFDIDDEEPQDDDDDEADDDDDDDDVASGSRGRRRAGARASARKPVTRATRQRKQPAKAVAAAAAVAPKTAVSHATKAAEPPLNNAADDEDATEDMELESKPQQPQHQHAVLSKAASTHDDPLFERHDAPPPAVVHAGPVEPLPDFLAAVHCHVLTKEPAFKNHLRRIAAAYGARIDNYVFPDTTHVVTDRKWDASYYSLQDEQPGIVFVLPEWLEQCHRTQTAVDADDYLVPEE